MAFHALIAVPLSAERPGGPWAGAGPVAPVPPKPGIAREFTIRTPAHPAPACQWRLSGRSVIWPALRAIGPNGSGAPAARTAANATRGARLRARRLRVTVTL